MGGVLMRPVMIFLAILIVCSGILASGILAARCPFSEPDPTSVSLDPTTLTFFNLPINSIRYAVAGYVPDAEMCVTLVWDFSNTGMDLRAHCNDFKNGFPYAILYKDKPANCGQWEYTSEVQVADVAGCIDFADFGPASLNLVDIELSVRSPIFSGRLKANNRQTFQAEPVTLGIAYNTDVPEDVYVQTGNEYALPEWVTLQKDGQPIQMFDRCDIPVCGESDGVCGQALPQVTNITQGKYSGSIYLNWDGWQRLYNTQNECWDRVAAEPGNYSAEFCIGWQLDELGQKVVSPDCEKISFTYPTPLVVWDANYGG
jgi:hypothetical protein